MSGFWKNSTLFWLKNCSSSNGADCCSIGVGTQEWEGFQFYFPALSKWKRQLLDLLTYFLSIFVCKYLSKKGLRHEGNWAAEPSRACLLCLVALHRFRPRHRPLAMPGGFGSGVHCWALRFCCVHMIGKILLLYINILHNHNNII